MYVCMYVYMCVCIHIDIYMYLYWLFCLPLLRLPLLLSKRGLPRQVLHQNQFLLHQNQSPPLSQYPPINSVTIL